MIGLDTNVIVRFIMQDDAAQSRAANRIVESLSVDEPGYLALITIVELDWVLTACYHLTRAQVGDVLEALLRTKELVVERSELMLKAARRHRNGNADLSDCLIAITAQAAGCTRTVTFDRNAAKRAGMELLA